MKLRELEPVLKSETGRIQSCIVYDSTNCKDVEYGCFAGYAIKNYGESEVRRIYSCYENGQDYIVIEVI